MSKNRMSRFWEVEGGVLTIIVLGDAHSHFRLFLFQCPVTYYVDQASLEVTLLPLSLRCWAQRGPLSPSLGTLNTTLALPRALDSLSSKGEKYCTLPAPCAQTAAPLCRFCFVVGFCCCCYFKYLSREHKLGFGSDQKELPWIAFFFFPSNK